MGQQITPDEIFDFPCEYQFKAFGDAALKDSFCHALLQTVRAVVPVADDNLQVRPSSGGRYVCVTLTARVTCRTEIEQVYAGLRTIEGLRYLL